MSDMSLGSQISMQAPRVLGVQEFHDRAMPSILDSWDKAVLRYMLLADLLFVLIILYPAQRMS